MISAIDAAYSMVRFTHLVCYVAEGAVRAAAGSGGARRVMREVVQDAREKLADRFTEKFFLWLLNGRMDSYLPALAMRSYLDKEAPDGIPLGAESERGCELFLRIQPELHGPRILISCAACGEETRFRTGSDLAKREGDLGRRCPVRIVMNS